jgi:hypothetical protein
MKFKREIQIKHSIERTTIYTVIHSCVGLRSRELEKLGAKAFSQILGLRLCREM